MNSRIPQTPADPTDRNPAEALFVSEEGFRTAFANSVMGAAVLGLDGRFLRVNQSLCEMLGRTEVELLGADFRTFTHPPDVEACVRSLNRLLVGEAESFREEKRYVHKNGHLVWAEISVALVRDASGAPVHFVGNVQDVTDRKAAEAALRRSEERYRSLLDNIPDVTWTVDASGRAVFISPNVERVFGFTQEDVYLGGERLWFERIHPDDTDMVRQAHERLFSHGERFDVEYRIRRKDEEWIWWHDRALSTYERDGVTYADGILSDVTERKRAEERLHAQKWELERIHRISAALAAELDLQRLVQLLTDEATALCGAQFGAYFYNVTGEGGEKYMLYTLSGAPREAFSRFPMPRATQMFGPTFRGEGAIRLDDVLGDPRYGHNAPYKGMPEDHLAVRSYLAVPVVSRTGEVLGGLFFGHPQTGVFTAWHEQLVTNVAAQAAVAIDNARLYREARDAERRFRLLIENATDIVSVLAADGTIRYESPSVGRVLDYRPEELVGRNWREFVHPDDLPWLEGVFASEVLKGGISSTVEYRFRHKDGSWRTLESIGNNLLAEPSIAGIVVNSRDVSDRKQAEEALRCSEEHLRQAQKMEAVGRLAGGIAHDFNNLLTVIGGYSAMLLRRLSPSDPLFSDATAIEQATRRAATLTRQLLSFSRGHVLQAKVLDLNSLVVGVRPMLQPLIGSHVDLVISLSPDLGRVRVDQGQLEQVLVNLAVNARDAMPRGGTLTITTADAERREGRRGARGSATAPRYVTLSVEDTGCGMDAETVEHIFEPFFTTKEQGKGTGLGLAMVYAIVERSGGWVEVDSEPGRGSRFTLLFPRLEDAADAAERTVQQLAATGGGETILVVEDEKGVRDLVCSVLTLGGYKVLVARDGLDALEVLERFPGEVHLVLTDVVMPKLGGPALVERLRPLRPGTRALLMSGYAEGGAVEEAIAAGQLTLLAKPFTPDDLTRAVRRVLDAPEE